MIMQHIRSQTSGSEEPEVCIYSDWNVIVYCLRLDIILWLGTKETIPQIQTTECDSQTASTSWSFSNYSLSCHSDN